MNVHVKHEGRGFTVHYEAGAAVRITERKLFAPNTHYAAFYNVTHWSRLHHGAARPGTLVHSVLLAAEAAVP